MDPPAPARRSIRELWAALDAAGINRCGLLLRSELEALLLQASTGGTGGASAPSSAAEDGAAGGAAAFAAAAPAAAAPAAAASSAAPSATSPLIPCDAGIACLHAGAHANLRCKWCRAVWYDSVECQRISWRGHRDACMTGKFARAAAFAQIGLSEDAVLPDSPADLNALLSPRAMRMMMIGAPACAALATSCFIDRCIARIEHGPDAGRAEIESFLQIFVYSHEASVAFFLIRVGLLRAITHSLTRDSDNPLPACFMMWRFIIDAGVDVTSAGLMPLLIRHFSSTSFGVAYQFAVIIKDAMIPKTMVIIELPVLREHMASGPRRYCAAAESFVAAGGLTALLVKAFNGPLDYESVAGNEFVSVYFLTLQAIIACNVDAWLVDIYRAAESAPQGWGSRQLSADVAWMREGDLPWHIQQAEEGDDDLHSVGNR